MDDNELKKIFQRYLANECSSEELDLLQSLLADKRYSERWAALLDEAWSAADGTTPPLDEREAKQILQRILAHNRPKRIRKLKSWYVAAAVLLIAGVATLTYRYMPANERHLDVQMVADVEPGGYKATLTYGNGKTVELDADQHGIVAVNDGFNYADGTVIDFAGGAERGGATHEYVELRTPRGGTYQITLSDGTRVWLNSETSLRYPAQFDDGDRHVILSGEAYFEVAKKSSGHRPAVPFRVVTSHQTVTVLGTQFNLNAYLSEPITTTTLVEGSVRISRTKAHNGRGAANVTLKPGQQAIAPTDDDRLITQTASAFQAASWKDRLFVFNDEPLADIMKRLARWYDFEVSYSGGAEHIRFTGNYNMDKGLRNLLENIELTEGIRFKLEKLPNNERRVIAIKD